MEEIKLDLREGNEENTVVGAGSIVTKVIPEK